MLDKNNPFIILFDIAKQERIRKFDDKFEEYYDEYYTQYEESDYSGCQEDDPDVLYDEYYMVDDVAQYLNVSKTTFKRYIKKFEKQGFNIIESLKTSKYPRGKYISYSNFKRILSNKVYKFMKDDFEKINIIYTYIHLREAKLNENIKQLQKELDNFDVQKNDMLEQIKKLTEENAFLLEHSKLRSSEKKKDNPYRYGKYHQKILAHIKQSGFITNKEVRALFPKEKANPSEADTSKISSKTAQRILHEMVELELLKHEGDYNSRKYTTK